MIVVLPPKNHLLQSSFLYSFTSLVKHRIVAPVYISTCLHLVGCDEWLPFSVIAISSYGGRIIPSTIARHYLLCLAAPRYSPSIIVTIQPHVHSGTLIKFRLQRGTIESVPGASSTTAQLWAGPKARSGKPLKADTTSIINNPTVKFSVGTHLRTQNMTFLSLLSLSIHHSSH